MCRAWLAVPSNRIDKRFAEIRREKESGLYWTQFREYNPTHGRWLSPDPAGRAAANPPNPQSWNRYAYVGNNAVDFIDPLGLSRVLVYEAAAGNCTLNGVDFPCAGLGSLISAGGAVACPGNICEGINGSGQPVYYVASAVGAGYFTYSGPGALYYSAEAAGDAAGLADKQASGNDSVMREYGETVYAEAGFYSFSQLQQGPACDPNTGACGPWSIDTTNVPEGAVVVGLAHDHPGTGFGSYDFSDADINTYITNGYYGFVATQPDSRVLMFDPNLYANWLNPGAPPPVCVLSGPLMGETACH